MEEVNRNSKYVIACSGGPDSMALLNMLYNEHINLVIAFVNYHKRSVSDYEEEKVNEYALKRNIPFYKLDAIKKTKSGNFQSWARGVRYDFFVDVLNKEEADAILVAHHKDDLLETFIFQEKRGGIYNHYGIDKITYYKNKKIIRPLLNYRKKELLEYCIQNNVFYSIDESNLTNHYSRNKIRHEVVEKLTDEEINAFIEKINLLNKEIKKEIALKNEYLKNETYLLSLFNNLEHNVQKRVIFDILCKLNIRVSGKEIENIILFLKGNSNAYKLKKDYVIYKNYDEFEIKKVKHNGINISVNKLSIIDNEFVYYDLINGKENFFIKDYSFPLTIKFAKHDEIVKIGLIHKKVNRLFIDEKIKLKYRDTWPCIYDKDNKLIFFPRKEIIENDNKIIFKVKE